MDKSFWKSTKEYLSAFGKWGFLVTALLVGDVLGTALSYYNNLVLPTWAWWLILAVILTISPLVAFHRLRLTRDELQDKLDQKPKLEILDIKDGIPSWETNKAIGQESFWLRLGVRNSGNSLATKCGGKITEVLDSDNHRIGHDLIPLCWIATYVGHSVLETELRPDEEKYLDVLVQKEKSPGPAYFAAPLTGQIDNLEQVPNEMSRLVIAVYSAESQSLAREFEIKWNDDAHSYKSLRMKKSTSDKVGSQT